MHSQLRSIILFGLFTSIFADLVRVTVVSNRKFDKTKIEDSMKMVDKAITDYMMTEHILLNPTRHSTRVAKNHAGLFAVVYNVKEDCEKVRSFVTGAKQYSEDFSYAIFNCNGRTTFI